MEEASIYEQVSGTEISEVADGYVIYDAVNDRVHFLNMTAAVVYELCDGQRSLQDIARIIDESYELDSTSLSEVETCLVSLQNERLVRRCP
jgi:hypothetical protein